MTTNVIGPACRAAGEVEDVEVRVERPGERAVGRFDDDQRHIRHLPSPAFAHLDASPGRR